MMSPSSSSSLGRRGFLQQMLLSPALHSPLLASLAAASAQAATTADDYKALVCIFMHGGNDSFNTVLGTSDSDWRAYSSVRTQQPSSIALLRDVAPDAGKAAYSPAALGGVLPLQGIDARQPSLALHPLLSPLVPLYNTQRRLAVMANVGPLVGPLSKADYLAGKVARPRKLFSHNDQQSTWQSMAPEGATLGWGGRLMDALMAGQDKSLFTAITVSGNSLWLSGRDVRAYQVASGGPVRMGSAQGMDAMSQALHDVVSSNYSGHVMAKDLADVSQRSILAEARLSAALPDGQIAPFGPDAAMLGVRRGTGSTVNPLAKALQTVGRIIACHQGLGLRRQVFFVSLGGFDTHAGQNTQHAWLMAQLGQGLAYFDGLMQSLGMGDKVTTFTASDFGRSFTSNGDGTDHGWGGHHFIMGGAVQGGKVFGTWPQLSVKNTRNNDFDGSGDQLTNGVLLPSTSVEQYGAALGAWLGVSASSLAEVFPNLSRFDRQPFGAGNSGLWRG
jgi:uncharacterized protein (DUF1501 family)